MTNKAYSIEELLNHQDLSAESVGELKAEKKEQIINKYNEQFVNSNEESEKNEPVYIKILAGGGAWLASLFASLFLAILFHDAIASYIIVGIIFIGVSHSMSKTDYSTFKSQFSLSMAIAGNALMLIGIIIVIDDFSFSILFATQFVLSLILYPLLNNGMFRFLLHFFLVSILISYMIDEKEFNLIHSIVGVETFLFCMWSTRKKLNKMFIPLYYSAATMLPFILLYMSSVHFDFFRSYFYADTRLSGLILSAGLLFIIFTISGGLKRVREPLFIFISIAVILLGLFSNPGILAAILILIVGHAYEDKVFLILSYTFLPLFIILFYYSVSIDLAYKAFILAGSGIIFLLLRKAVSYFYPNGEIS